MDTVTPELCDWCGGGGETADTPMGTPCRECGGSGRKESSMADQTTYYGPIEETTCATCGKTITYGIGGFKGLAWCEVACLPKEDFPNV